MWMWTVGYTVGDVVGLASTTVDQKQANWVSRVLWVLVLVGLGAYSGYQIFLSYESYQNPQWSSGVDFENQISFPAILICPFAKNTDAFKFGIENSTCIYFPDGLNGNTSANCSHTTLKIRNGRFNGQSCLLYNSVDTDNYPALVDLHSFLLISYVANNTHIGPIRIPFAVMLYSPDNSGIPLTDTPSFLTVVDTSYWAVLSRSEDYYLDNPSPDVSYYVSVSSASITPNQRSVSSCELDQDGAVSFQGLGKDSTSLVQITFSFASFSITTNSEYVEYDWLTLLGTLGGASAFAMAIHTVVMIIYEKSMGCWKKRKAKKANATAQAGGDDDDGGDENASLVNGKDESDGNGLNDEDSKWKSYYRPPPKLDMAKAGSRGSQGYW